MRKTLLLSAIALASCGVEPDTFTVDDPSALAKSAVLQLDGSDQRLERDRGRWTTTRQIRRDADGRVRVLYHDGRKVDCLIGYVTPGAPQHWRYRLTPTSCEPV